jgi:hypothetical protein
MAISGGLCFVSALGPLSGQMRIAWLGILWYAFMLPVSCVLLPVLFRQTDQTPAARPSG